MTFDWYNLVKRHGMRDVVDAGANEGGWISAWFEAGATRVIAIEPVPDVFETLTKRFEKDARVVRLNLAVSDEPGFAPAQNIHNCWTLRPQGDRALEPAVEYAGKPSFDVNFDTIDAICAREGMVPDFIKIDVDGYDARALRGARRVITAARPLMMLEMSYLPHFFGDCCECMVREVIDLGYRMQSVVTGESFTDARGFMRKFPWDTSFDVVLWPPEKSA